MAGKGFGRELNKRVSICVNKYSFQRHDILTPPMIEPSLQYGVPQLWRSAYRHSLYHTEFQALGCRSLVSVTHNRH